jgi:hypothetical protein
MGKTLILWHLAYIQKPGRINGACLQIFEDCILIWDNAKYYLIQVGQPFTSPVIPGIAH